MKITFLQANNGDAIHLRFQDDETAAFRNILIDGGTGKTYQFKNKKGKQTPGDLKKTIDAIRQRKEMIDLLVLTHVDDDHIGGILKWFANDREAHRLIGRVWFNAGRSIARFFKQNPNNIIPTRLLHPASRDTSIRQGIAFDEYLTRHNIPPELVIAPGHRKLFGLDFHLLSPTREKLELLLAKWEKEMPRTDTAHTTDYHNGINELLDADVFREDQAVHNGSAIAFVISYRNKNLLFLGDAHPQVLIDSLRQLGYSEDKPIKAALVKLAHHGSKGNTNAALLALLDCQHFVISTNGGVHGLPDKVCLARIIRQKAAPVLLFNYPDLIPRIFTPEDKMAWPHFKAEGIVSFVIGD